MNLRAAGMGVGDLVKVTFYLVGGVDLEPDGRWWRPGSSTTAPPAMTLLS